MGMFDTVTVVNISNENFDDNGLSFQTKCLENKLVGLSVILWRKLFIKNEHPKIL